MINYKIEHIQEVSSTNSYLKDLLKETKAKEGTVILADFQSSGRGQGTSEWISDRAENLTCSILLEPCLHVSQHFSLVEFISLALLDTLGLFGIKSLIKWPNDMYVASKKISGILIENVIAENTISSSIVGVGLNVNQVIFPAALPNPVSMKLLLHQPMKRDEVFKEFLNRLNIRYDQLKKGSFNLLHYEYCENSMGLGRKIRYKKKGVLQEGMLLRISEKGELFIEDEKGRLTGYLFGDVQILPSE